MKYTIFLGFAACLFFNCRLSTNKASSVFLQKPQSKSSLLASGFSHPKPMPLDSAGLVFDGPTAKHIKDVMEQGGRNIFTKKKGDTIISYWFRDEDLAKIYIQIPMVHVDTTKLFNLLSDLGFVRTKIANSSFEEFANQKEHIQYGMAFSQRVVLFTNNVGNLAEGTPPLGGQGN